MIWLSVHARLFRRFAINLVCNSSPKHRSTKPTDPVWVQTADLVSMPVWLNCNELVRRWTAPSPRMCIFQNNARLQVKPWNFCKFPHFFAAKRTCSAAAATGRAVNVKKGQFMSPGEMSGVLGKLPSLPPCSPNVEHSLATTAGQRFHRTGRNA